MVLASIGPLTPVPRTQSYHPEDRAAGYGRSLTAALSVTRPPRRLGHAPPFVLLIVDRDRRRLVVGSLSRKISSLGYCPLARKRHGVDVDDRHRSVQMFGCESELRVVTVPRVVWGVAGSAAVPPPAGRRRPHAPVRLAAVGSDVALARRIAIRLDDHGPTFHTQHRIGANGAVSDDQVRSISLAAEQRLPELRGVGRILRAYSIDGLPQLFTVLNGTMSLVGPHRWHLMRPDST